MTETTRDLIYGRAWFHDCLAFANATTAAEEADEIVAIATAPTWRAAAGGRCQHISNPVASQLEDEDPDDPETDWDAPFDIFSAYGVSDGDWPPMVTSRALELLPADIAGKFGNIVFTSFNGEYLNIPVAVEGE